MDPSTPLPTDKKRALLLSSENNASPLRRSIIPLTTINSESKLPNDEDERADRRSQLQIQKRLSTIPPAINTLNESFIKEQFVLYTHLFTENKITAKNAWKVQIIDMLRPLCQHSRPDLLKIASTSIDISAKVYGIRVDDVHSEGLKLANNMARVSEIATSTEKDDEVHSEEEQDVAVEKKKRKKKVNPTGKKTTINRNPKGNLGKLPKLEPVDFTTRVNADTGTIDNLLTNVLKETPTSFVLLDDKKKLVETFDPIAANKEKVSFKNLPLPRKLGKINAAFNDFVVDEWNPDQEEKLMFQEKTLSEAQPVVFDENGYPIPELDGSVHGLCETKDDETDCEDKNDKDDDEIRAGCSKAPELRGGFANVVDFRPSNSTAQSSEYSYNPIIMTSSGKYIDQIWAGPSHWKLKVLKRPKPKFSGQEPSETKAKRGKKREPERVISADADPSNVDISKTLTIKKRPPIADMNKITLPFMDQSCVRVMANIKELMLKPGVCPVEKPKPAPENQEDYEVSAYNYENPNDSMYCSQTQQNANENDDSHNADDNVVDDEGQGSQLVGNLADNLVDNPEMVPSTYIQYASKAKQIDMKRLKTAIWLKLTDNKKKGQEGKVVTQKFSDLYKALPEVLSSNEKEKLSSPLAFFALLHLANEKNLYLKQLPGTKDCEIHGPEYNENLPGTSGSSEFHDLDYHENLPGTSRGTEIHGPEYYENLPGTSRGTEFHGPEYYENLPGTSRGSAFHGPAYYENLPGTSRGNEFHGPEYYENLPGTSKDCEFHGPDDYENLPGTSKDV